MKIPEGLLLKISKEKKKKYSKNKSIVRKSLT